MECRELFARLSEFLDGELTADVCRELQEHLKGCPPCEAFARTLRTTVDLCHRLPPRPLPEDVKRDLRVLLDRVAQRP